MSDNSVLVDGLAKLGFSAAETESAATLLGRYMEEIELFNPAYGLVKVQNHRELIVKHILDSLAPLGTLRRLADAGLQGKPGACRVADLGSGAGLPGIPLAICMPAVQFTLVERMGRRAGFLRDVLAALALPNVLVEEKEMERVKDRFNIIVFRAFRPLEPGIFNGVLKLLLPGGLIAAYKGRREAVEEEMSRLCETAAKLPRWEILPLEVPFLEEERHLLLIHC